MTCPYFRPARVLAGGPVCLGTVVPFEPSEKDLEYCTTDRHRWCPLYRCADRQLASVAYRDLVGAIGS